MLAIETRELRKVYVTHKKSPGVGGAFKGLFSREKVEVEAVKDITFSIEQGELVGFLGPNGAGKTTTLKILSGILYPTAGEARVLGFTPFDRKPDMLRRIALVMGNKQQLWWDLTAWDSFLVLKELYEVEESAFKKRADALIETLQLSEKVNTQVRKLSLGERMKCELVAALLHAPQVVFLDEPTLGLDVVSQKRIRDFLRELHREDGSTLLLTSHYMQDVQELAERVIVIDRGALIFDGTLPALTRRFSDTRRLRLAFEQPVDPKDFAKYGEVVEQEECALVLAVPREQTARVTAAILKEFPVNDVGIEEVSVDEVVRELFSGKSLAGDEATVPESAPAAN